MSYIYSIAVNDTEYELPSMNQISSQLQDLEQAMSSTGVAAHEMTQAINRISEILANLEYHSNEITAIKNNLHNLQCETERIQQKLDCHTAISEIELNDLRSALEEKTETPNQKGDLEIFSQIEWDEEFLKIMNEPIIVDF